MDKFHFDHSKTKVQQLADLIASSISANEYVEGEKLPSINILSKKHKVSRDTVFKSFLLLKDKGIVDSIQGKSYYVSNSSTNIFLLLDEYTPFKEALYNKLIEKLPSNIKVDLWFHQYNEELFNTIINEAYGRYSKYIVMNYDNEKFSEILRKINNERLLLLDFGKFDKKDYCYVCQDFDQSFYNALDSIKEKLRKYTQLTFVVNKRHKHPQSSKDFFKSFCKDNNFNCEVVDCVKDIQKANFYIVTKQTDVITLIKKSREQQFEIGKDFGMIAYNENPLYEIIGNGISTISVDFELMGSLAANFVLGKEIKLFLPTKIKKRNSF